MKYVIETKRGPDTLYHQLPESITFQDNEAARLFPLAPRMAQLLEAIEAYQKDGLNRWEWIQSEVNSVLAEIRGK